MREKVVITAGPTKEAIDDVRLVTNMSTGKFGSEIADQVSKRRSLTKRRYDIIFLRPREVPLFAGKRIDGATEVDTTDTESMKNAILGVERADIVFHSAAVADFKPENPVEGKISSKLDELNVRFVPTEKIISYLRGHFGQETFLVGFKLLSGASREELIGMALNQNKKNHLNLTVANDKMELLKQRGHHPVILVTPEGGAIDLRGKRGTVAKELVKFVEKRKEVSWYRSEKTDLDKPSVEQKERFEQVLSFAQRLNLLTDTSGNVSVRTEKGLLATPRQVDKSMTSVENAVVVSVDQDNRSVFYDGEIKPSIDSGVSDSLYKKFPNIESLIHFHNGWGDFLNKTFFPYPCGVKEEAIEILSEIEERDQKEFSLELNHHGFLLGISEGSIERLESEWTLVLEEFKKHLADVNQEDAIETGVLKPIFSGIEIVGVVREKEKATVMYLGERSRGRGIGRKIIDQLIERQMAIQTIDECGVVDFYKKFGFKGEKDEQTGMYTLYPPLIKESDEIFRRRESIQKKIKKRKIRKEIND